MMATLNIDIDLDDLLWDLSDDEKQKLSDMLYDEGFIPKEIPNEIVDISHLNVIELEWLRLIEKLKNKRLSISNDDIEIINNILKKY